MLQNLHLYNVFVRVVSGDILGCDVVWVEIEGLQMDVSADLIVNAMLVIWNLGKPLMTVHTDDTHTDQTNQNGIHLECSLRLST